MPLPLGELAALGTACCWTGSSLAFSAAGRRMGSLSLNLVRLVIAFCFLSVYGGIRRGQVLPLDASPQTWTWLLVSGLVGYVLGDICLFRAFVLIGPRLSMLIMALAPPMTAALGFFFLNERISAVGLLGMAVTIAGVVWVIRERSESSASNPADPKGNTLRQGIFLGFGAALGQAGGLVLSKIGMGNYDPVASGQIRVLAGAIGFAILFFIVGWWKKTREAIRDKTAMRYATLGAFMGPVMGVSLSLFAVQHTETGIAATIMSTTPVLIIPVVVLAKLEKVSIRSGIGALVAVVGVAMLWLR